MAASVGTSPTPSVPAKRGLARLAGPMMLAIALQAAANLLFHAILGRYLSPAEYGALGALLAAMTLVAVPLNALQTAAARAAAGDALTGRTGVTALRRNFLQLLPVAGLLLLATPAFTAFLHLDNWWDAALLAPTVLVAGLLATARGLLLGVARTSLVAGTYVVGLVGRLAIGIPLAVGFGVTGALVGTLLGELLALLVAARAVWPSKPGTSLIVTGRDLSTTTVVTVGLFVFTTVDLFLARHFLAGAESGAYVAAATIGKTILALPAAAVAVVFPRLTQAWATQSKRGATMRAALLVVVTPAILGGLVIVAFPGLVLSVLYGDSFAGTEPLVRILAAVAAASALVSVLTHAALARNSRVALLPWLAAGFEIAVIVIWHETATQIALGSLASLVLAVVALLAVEARHWRG